MVEDMEESQNVTIPKIGPKESSIIPHYVYAPLLVQRFQLFSFGISLLQFEMDDNLVYKNQQLERINQTEKGGCH